MGDQILYCCSLILYFLFLCSQLLISLWIFFCLLHKFAYERFGHLEMLSYVNLKDMLVKVHSNDTFTSGSRKLLKMTLFELSGDTSAGFVP